MVNEFREFNIKKLFIEAKKQKQKRKIKPEYEKIKSSLSQPKITASEIKLNITHKVKVLNQLQSLKLSKSLNSLVKSKKENLITAPNELKNFKKNTIHQLVPVLAPRDAVGNEVLAIRSLLRNLGYASEIYVETIHPEMAHEVKSYFPIKGKFEPDIIIYHHAIGSKLVDAILNSSAKIIVIYHNLTPEEYFVGINDEIVQNIRQGKKQLDELRDSASLVVTHSNFSAQELRKKEFLNVKVIPFLFDFSTYDIKPDEEIVRKFKKNVNFLFVGRLVPHKKIENILKVFSYYNTCINSNSNLFLVGNNTGTEKYYQWLRYLIKESKLANIHFANKVEYKDLAAYYKIANVYLSMSEHEGFGASLVESMHFGVPIIAYKSSAIPETLGEASIIVDNESSEEIGEVIDLILNNNGIREKIIQNQKERLKMFDSNKIIKEFENTIQSLLNN